VIAFGPARELPFRENPDWGQLLTGPAAGCVEALEQVVLPLGARTTVPGHGPASEGTAPVEATLDYLRFVLDLAARGRAAGVSPLDAARGTELGRFAGWPDAERIVGNLYRAYAEPGGTPRRGPVDVFGALADKVAYNDGKPLTCLALSGRPRPHLHRAFVISAPRPRSRASVRGCRWTLPPTG
jgi:hypothetical protein